MPPFKRVYFYGRSNNGTGHDTWRLIRSLGRSAYEDRVAPAPYVYKVEYRNAGDLYDLLDDSEGEDNFTGGMVIAIGVRDDYEVVITEAMMETDGVSHDAGSDGGQDGRGGPG